MEDDIIKEIQALDEDFQVHFGLISSHRDVNEVETNPTDTELFTDDEDATHEPVYRERVTTFLNDQPVEECNDTDPFVDTEPILYKDCTCQNKCTTNLGRSTIVDNIISLREMEKVEKEQFIMTILYMCTSEQCSAKTDRKRNFHRYSFLGQQICRDAFMSINDINDFTLRALSSHVQDNGVSPRKHGNTGRKPAHALKYDDVLNVVQFLRSYSDEHGLPQPAAPRGRDNLPPIYLPSSMTKKEIHLLYYTGHEEGNVRRVRRSVFCNIWQNCVPEIIIATPRHDVCSRCEKLRKCITDAVTDEAKLTSSTQMQEHILRAQEEKSYYTACVRESQAAIADSDIPTVMHFTFDFAQNVCLPHHARQMGPLYFLSLKKVQVFGFRSDGENKQKLYLFDEGQTIGQDGKHAHGPDAVISMIHHGIEQLTRGEDTCSFHADNCAGQNKNRYVVAYFMWRVMTGKQEEISYHMQIPGHGRCLVDAGFAHFKRIYRRCDADCLADLQEQVRKSSSTNEPVMYPEWSWYGWKEFLAKYFKAVPKISTYQHFRVSASRPGVVFCRVAPTDEEAEYNILQTAAGLPAELPSLIVAGGISPQRLKYLHQHVRPFVRPRHQEETCPSPGEE